MVKYIYEREMDNYMNIDIKRILREIKNSNYIPFFIFLLTSILLFAPKKYLEILHLNELISNYGWIIGLLFLISVIILFINIVYAIYNFIIRHIKKLN